MSSKILKNSYKIKKTLLVLPLCLLLIGGIFAGTNLSRKSDQKKLYSYKETGSVLGASVSNQSVTVSADKIKQETEAEGLIQGYRRVTLTITIQNNSANIIQFSPGLNIKALDKSGVSYYPTMKFNAPGVAIGGPIDSGQKLTLDIDFEVPETTSLEKLVYQQDQVSEKLEIKL